jgi:hypothetical protein
MTGWQFLRALVAARPLRRPWARPAVRQPPPSGDVAEFLDVDMDQFPGSLPLVAADPGAAAPVQVR